MDTHPPRSLPLVLLALCSLIPAQGKNRAPRVERYLGVPHDVVARAPVAPAAVAQETEYNASPAWADPLGPNTVFQGSISTVTDNDLVRFELVQDSMVMASVTGVGSTPLADPALFLTDAFEQYVAFSDDANGTTDPALALPLPPGVYYARIYSNVGTGDYALTLTSTPATLPVLPFGQVVQSSIAQPGEAVGHRVHFAVDGEIQFRVPNANGLDLDVVVHRMSGGVVVTIRGTYVGPTPDFDLRLPAGDYLLDITARNGGTGPFDIRADFIAGALPALACGTSTPGSAVQLNVGEFPMFELTLPAATDVDLEVVQGAINPITDSIMWVFDRDLMWFTYSEDVGANTMSRRRTYLPAGTYYVAVVPTSGAAGGTFFINTNCAAPAALAPTRVGWNPGTIPVTAGTAAFAFSTPTDTPLNARVVPNTIVDGSVAILDPSGKARLFNDYATNFEGIGLPAGDYVMLVWDYFGSSGTFDLDLRGSIAFQAATKGTLSLRDKVGRSLFLFATPSLAPTPLPIPVPFTGRLALDLSAFVALPPVAISGSGLLSHPVTFPDAPYFVQGLLLDAGPLGGAMTNVTH